MMTPLQSLDALCRTPPLAAALGWLSSRQVGAWLVGGVVRDALLGRPMYDLDLAVAGPAVEVARDLADALGRPFVLLDQEHGIARVVLADGLALDLAAVRGSLEQDLALRDFTINAIAYDPSLHRLVDPVCGVEDVARGIIRVTGPGVLAEDPLRLLRAVRFQATLGFELDPATAEAIRRHASLLAEPAAERRRDELFKILACPGAARWLRSLRELDLLDRVVPGTGALAGVTQNRWHHLDVWDHTLAAVERLEADLAANLADWAPYVPDQLDSLSTVRVDQAAVLAADPPSGTPHSRDSTLAAAAAALRAPLAGDRDSLAFLKLAVLLHDVGKPLVRAVSEDGAVTFHGHEEAGSRMAAEVAAMLRLSRRERAMLPALVAHHLRPLQLASETRATPRALARFFRETAGIQPHLLALAWADGEAAQGPSATAERRLHRRRFLGQRLAEWMLDSPIAKPTPYLTGGDLVGRFGLAPGPGVGALLGRLARAAAHGRIHSRAEAEVLVQGWLSRRSKTWGRIAPDKNE